MRLNAVSKYHLFNFTAALIIEYYYSRKTSASVPNIFTNSRAVNNAYHIIVGS